MRRCRYCGDDTAPLVERRCATSAEETGGDPPLILHVETVLLCPDCLRKTATYSVEGKA